MDGQNGLQFRIMVSMAFKGIGRGLLTDMVCLDFYRIWILLFFRIGSVCSEDSDISFLLIQRCNKDSP